jgi:hypothetical protein
VSGVGPRGWLPAALAGLLLLAAGRPAAAQLITREGDQYRTPQRFALELRFGPYSPNVDEEFDQRDSARAPHDEFFGDDRRFMFQIELDWQIFRGFGTAAIGGSVGYFRENARAYLDSGAGKAINDAEGRSADNSRLSLYPFAVLAVYRADQLWSLWDIPLVPYGKVGLNYTIWSVYDGNDRVASSPEVGGRGRGGTAGWQAAAGVSLVLDFIDSGAARALDGETGINHTHVFFEYAKYEASGLGQDDKLHVGDTTWVTGLMFEF